MKKTRLIIIIAVALVIFIGAAVWGIVYNSGKETVYVQSIAFTNENGTVSYEQDHILNFDYSQNSKSVQLHAKVLPANADNKALEFTDNSDNAAVDENGRVTFSKFTGVTSITAKSKDGSAKSATIRLLPIYNGTIPLSYNFAENIFTSVETNLMFSAKDTLTLYELGNSYVITAPGVTFQVKGVSDVVSITDSTIKINETGTFTLSATSGGVTKDITVKVEQYLDLSLAPSFADKSGESYVVGSHNNFSLPFIISDKNGDTKTLAITESEIYFSKKTESVYPEYAPLHGNSALTLDREAMTVKFADTENGALYKLKIETAGKTLEFNFVVRDVSNITSDEEFKAALTDTSSHGVAFHKKITAAPRAGTTVEVKGKTYLNNSMDDGAIPDVYRVHFPDELDVQRYEIAGNGNDLDAGGIPTCISKNDEGRWEDPTREGYYKSHDVGLITFHGKVHTTVVHDLSIKGNAQRSDNPEMYGSVSLLNFGRFRSRVEVAELTDLNLVGGLTGVIFNFVTNAHLKNVKVQDTFANSVNIYDGAVTLEDCSLIKSGGPLLHLGMWGGNATLKVKGTLVAENWMSGKSQWMQNAGLSGDLLAGMKSTLNDGINYQTQGAMVIIAKDTAETEYFNFVLYGSASLEYEAAAEWTVDFREYSSTEVGSGALTGLGLQPTGNPVTGAVLPSYVVSKTAASLNNGAEPLSVFAPAGLPHYMLIETPFRGSKIILVVECIGTGASLEQVDQSGALTLK